MGFCTLDDQTRQCEMKCGGCGFNLKEQKQREKLFEKNGLTLCKDGLRRLIIKREENEE